MKRRGQQKSRLHQHLLEERLWGGRRAEAGRNKARPNAMPHARRVALRKSEPLHVTVKLVRDLPSLRRKREYAVVCQALAGARDRALQVGLGFRVVQYSIQSNHMHLLVEAETGARWRGGCRAS